MVAFESISKLLLFLHLGCAVAALATALHILLRFSRVWRGRPQFYRPLPLHGAILLSTYTAALGLGALIYPTFRVRVRYEYFDAHLPWATALFEMKEHAAALGLFPVLIVFVLTRPLAPERPLEAGYVPLFVGALAFVLAVLGFNAWCGWYLGTLRSI